VPFDNIADWDNWQTKVLCARADDIPDGEAVFSDDGVSMDLLKARHGQTTIGKES
jgi:hypothetical protein